MEIAILEILLRDNLRDKGNLYLMMGVGIMDNSKMGFELSDKTLKRAGLDYWDHIDWNYFPDLEKYCENLVKNERFHLLTTKSSEPYTSRRFIDEDHLVFGSETSGINEIFLKENWNNTCTIPMDNSNIRSLNLATSVGIVLYEAIRQTDAI